MICQLYFNVTNNTGDIFYLLIFSSTLGKSYLTVNLLKMINKNQVFLTFLLICTISISFAQKVEFKSTSYDGIKKLKTVNVGELDDKYLPHLQNLEAPDVSGNKYKAFLAQRKEEIKKLYPPSNELVAKKRSIVNPPEVIKVFPIIGVSTGIPCDNHLAMNGDDIVSAGNFYMAVNNPNGGFSKKFTLDEFAQAAGITNQPFDPRLAYDPASNKYIFTFLAGSNSSNTDIVVAFSETADPTGNWNIYSLPGNPNELNEWTDYPMISITNEHVYITINLLKDNESWQLGFIETIIWQMDKSTGYDGIDLGVERIDGITFGGQNIRNLCPAESATESMFDDIYFVSNRNFAVEADSFFLVKVDPNASSPEEQVEINFIQSDTPYGAPPNAAQIEGFFQTNDARVLEAFRLDDEIQFVGNTRNLDNNKAGIYHGIIESISDPQMIRLNHIIGSDFEIGYPGITYTGETSSDRDAIIAFNHTSNTEFPGVSAVYSIPEEGYSRIVELGKGNNFVDMLNADLERWGDYLGTQRDYNNPKTVWVSGLIGIGNKINAPLICRVERPENPTGIEEETSFDPTTTVFPNPLQDRISIKMFIASNPNSIRIDLYGINGEKIDNLYTSNSVKYGQNSFSFNASSLSSGTYLVKVMLDGKLYETKTVVKM